MKLLSLLLALIALSSCSHPITATSNKVGSAQGKACSRNILFIIPLSIDRSIYAAAENGEIEKISTVDGEYFFTGIYNSHCTIVHGHKKIAQVERKVSNPVSAPVAIPEPEKTPTEATESDSPPESLEPDQLIND